MYKEINLDADFKLLCFVGRVEYAHNTKIKRNKKKKGFER